jgi:PPOX class probable F420-dependent enzyme
MPVRKAKTILLTTYKRDGTPVPTPVSIAFDHDRAFFRSFDKAWKTKRLRWLARHDVRESALAIRKGRLYALSA